MFGILAALIPSLVPVVSDGIRGVVNKLTGGAGAQPANVEEAVKLMNADVERLKALAELDKPQGNISTWVSDLRASFRYIAAGCIIIAALGMAMMGSDKEMTDMVWTGAQSAWSFIFGERMYSYLRRK